MDLHEIRFWPNVLEVWVNGLIECAHKVFILGRPTVLKPRCDMLRT
jgi:hypothetical protein